VVPTSAQIVAAASFKPCATQCSSPADRTIRASAESTVLERLPASGDEKRLEPVRGGAKRLI
jgi:hypothetical protein